MTELELKLRIADLSIEERKLECSSDMSYLARADKISCLKWGRTQLIDEHLKTKRVAEEFLRDKSDAEKAQIFDALAVATANGDKIRQWVKTMEEVREFLKKEGEK